MFTWYGAHKEIFTLLFEHNFVTVADVLGKARKNYGRRTRLKLINEHRMLMKNDAMVEKVGCNRFISKFQPDMLVDVAQQRMREYLSSSTK